MKEDSLVRQLMKILSLLWVLSKIILKFFLFQEEWNTSLLFMNVFLYTVDGSRFISESMFLTDSF